jgi:23S rRNA (guanosine2251-2'-O)-methyltransferase
VSRSDTVYGLHAVEALLRHNPEQVLEFWVLAGSPNPPLAVLAALAGDQGIIVQRAGRATLDRLAGGGRHQGAVVRCRRPEAAAVVTLGDLLGDVRDALFLILDGVEDPQNLGACLRVADAAGARAVIRPLHRGVGLTAAAIKVASGAAESVPVVAVPNLARALADLKSAGVWIVGTDAGAEQSIYDVDLKSPTALVLGAEGSGMRRLTRDLCDRRVSIPMAGTVESLNVAVAAGVCLFEAVRQRR